MSSHATGLPRAALRRRVPVLTATLARAARWPHLLGVSAQFGLGLWLCRAFAGSAIPAGTDMLGFVSRAAVNARGSTWLSSWSPDSLGAPRQLTLESLLGLMTKVTGDPVVTVKLFVLTTLVASGVGAYWLTWRWYHTRLGATVAGLLYITGQTSLAQTASGHLNVCVVVALAPVVLGLTVDGVESFSPVRACLLGVALALLVLARPDMALYLLPFVVLYVPVRGFAERRLRESLRNGALTAVVAIGTAFALSLYDLVPMLAGVRAEWVSSGGLFGLQEFNARSIPALGSLLGFAREIGYLAFTNRQTWTSHPWLSFGIYAGLAAIPIAAAWGALALRRDARTLYLLGCVIFGAFAAKGMHQPFGGPYKWAALHVPVFANLRDPDRWLIAGSLAVAVLAGFTASRLPALLRRLDVSRPACVVLGVALAVLVLLPNAPTVAPGLATWRPTPGQITVMHVAGRGDAPLATVPFDQTRRYLVDGSYQGWEHDLGAESALWTGRPALADGGWSSPAAATISYLTTLLDRRDPAFSPMLGALGVGDLLSLHYSPTAPNLINPAHPYYQQQAAATLPGLTLSHRTGAGSLFRVGGAAAQLSARPLSAVVLGGLSGMRALARLPGIVPSRWAATDAAGLLSAGGEPRLLAAIRQADLVMVADTSINDLAVVSARPVAELPGISSDPDLARATQTLPPDVATRTGALVDPDAVPPLAGAARTRESFTLTRAQPVVELWVHVQALYNPAKLNFSIDGRPAGSVTPLAPADAGFSWVRVGSRGLAAGRHVLSVRTTRSVYGNSYELDAARLLTASARLRANQALRSALAQAAPRTAYAADLSSGLRTVNDPGFFRPTRAIGGGVGYWKTLDPNRSLLSDVDGALTLSFSARRRYHTLLAHYFAAPRNWSQHAYAFLHVRGQASGATYSVLIDGDARHSQTIQLPWTDDSTGWRLLAIPMLDDPMVARHVVSVRIATDDTGRTGRLQIGTLSLSRSADALVEHLPIPSSAARRAVIVYQRQRRAGRRNSIEHEWASQIAGGRISTRVALRALDEHNLSSAVRRAVIVYQRQRRAGRGNSIEHERGSKVAGGGISTRVALGALDEHNLLLVPPRAGIPTAPPAELRWNRLSADRFSFDVRAARPITLVIGLSQDPHWQLTGVHGAVATRAWGALQAWRLPAGHYRGTISFAGDRLVRAGMMVSAAFLLVLALLGLRRHRRMKRFASERVRPSGFHRTVRADRPPISPRLSFLLNRLVGLWRVPWLAAFALLVPIPVVVAGGPNEAADVLAVAATIAITLAVLFAAVATRRSCVNRDS